MPILEHPHLSICKEPNYFRVEKPLTWKHPYTGEVFSVPVGIRTNLASVPWFLRWYFNVNGESRIAAILHDYHYGLEHFPQKKADKVFLMGCLEQGMRPTQARIGYIVLRLFGWTHR